MQVEKFFDDKNPELSIVLEYSEGPLPP